MKNERFRGLFEFRKPIIGMIHLAGDNQTSRVKRALQELAVYQEEGVDGAIIEDYFGSPGDVYETLKQSSSLKLNITRGVNVLSNPYSAFGLASEFGARFIQLDTVQTRDLSPDIYDRLRTSYPHIAVFGGNWF